MHRRVEEYEDPAEVLRMARLAVKGKEDNDDLQRYFRKLRTCAAITQDALKCNEACNAVRRKRIHVDANDRVDSALGKEKDTIGDCNKQMREFSAIIDRQIEINDGKNITNK
uniref:Uncharacterized protein n=1 Tax=Panagrolaimus sp. ES5 TaxID=591445 RepID=A0AC34FZI3_9BILA